MEQPKDSELDPFDLKILDTVMEDGRISITELSEKVGLSKTPCQQRVKRLVDSGLTTSMWQAPGLERRPPVVPAP